MPISRAVLLTLFLSVVLVSAAHAAVDPPLMARIGDLPLERGGVITDCRLEYRTLGTLNPERTNAVLFPTWFSGRTEQLLDNAGPGEPLDPTRYFIVFVGALGNGRSSSPSTAPGQPAAAFPSYTIADMVNAEHRLLTDVLHLDGLHAVIGISMGGMQVFEWSVRYPDFARRFVAIVGTPQLSPYDELLWRTELGILDRALAVSCDEATKRRVMASVGEVHELALSTPAHVNATVARGSFDAWLAEREAFYVSSWDPLDWASQLQAMLHHDVSARDGGDLKAAARRVRGRMLAVLAVQDHMVNPSSAREFVGLAGGQIVDLPGDCGHLANGCESGTVASAVSRFLAQP
jgi:homoserine O-acetyltransferase